MRSLLPPLRTAAAALVALVPCTAAHAQWVTGVGGDAIVLSRGIVRGSVGGSFGGFDERFSSAADGTAGSARRPYGADLTVASLDAAALPALGTLDAALRSVAGGTIPGVTFGPFGVTADARRAELPIRVDVGVGRGVQLFVAGAYVQTRVAVQVTGDATAREGNVGVDPAVGDAGAASANAALLAQLRTAAAQLDAQLARCGTAAAPACASPADAAALRAQLATVASSLEASYGSGNRATLGVVPVVGSPIAAAIDARVAALAAAARAYGVDAVPTGARPRHAAAPFTPGALAALADSGSAALRLPPIRDSRGYGISDVEVGVRVRVRDPLGGRLNVADAAAGMRVRVALTALVRLPTGTADDPLDPLDVGTGDSQTDVEVGAAADVLRGRRFIGSVVARYGVQLADELTRPVPPAGPLGVDVSAVSRDLGDYLELEVTPRYALNESLTLAGHYRFRAKGDDAYKAPGTSGPEANSVEVAFGAGTATRQHALGAGIVFSTLPSYARGGTRVPLDVVYQRTLTIAGAGRLAERETRDAVTVRVYLTPFGRR